MAQTVSTYQLFVGVDIAATSFTATWGTSVPVRERPFTLPQTPTGFTTLQERLATTGVAPAHTLVVLEATSTYWIQLAVTVHQAGYVVSFVNPQQVHHYAKSLVRRGKTDALDAQLLTQFASERCPEPWTPPPAVYHELRQRLSARALLLSTRQQVRNHRHALIQWPVVVAGVQEQLEQVIAQLDAQIVALDTAIAQVLAHGEWAESALLLQSITGVGTLTTAWLLVTTLNFTLGSTPNALSAYAGLAPHPHDSGSSIHSRRRIGHAGNRQLRTALYLATLSAARRNPMIRTFYTRLRAAGKPMKVARCAAARKLLHLAWAVVTKHQPFDPQRHTQVDGGVEEMHG